MFALDLSEDDAVDAAYRDRPIAWALVDATHCTRSARPSFGVPATSRMPTASCLQAARGWASSPRITQTAADDDRRPIFLLWSVVYRRRSGALGYSDSA
jgi:hypothetical protein